MGDPAGVGPEICLRLLANADLARECVPIVFGDAGVLRRVAEKLGLPLTCPVMARAKWPTHHHMVRMPSVVDFQCVDAVTVTPGQVDPRCGDAAFRYVTASIEAGLKSEVAAITTAPLNKEALHAAGHKYPGHTEIFAERMRAERSCMTFFSDELTCSLVTVHIGYHEVSAALTIRRILDVIELTADAVRRRRGREPRLAVLGLNPHAGEHGLFGRGEEERIIAPAVEAARAAGLTITGPLPPDTAFLPARRRETDAFICMYHDQALIPLKALAFDSAVNTTLGLPVVRTSVDHGTAFDIAWHGKASAENLFAAVRLAAKLAGQYPCASGATQFL
ncbi:MAG: 4-hydroxythreonine-4-phosphate dehydrogenase PdxA [Verrucomicrobia bacterium]|nr:4-hydroxythreonine-4-phosphate dehydrogenase PdxA [Verrucomicrobiota bacterium]